jgi:hypothetical protein
MHVCIGIGGVMNMVRDGYPTQKGVHDTATELEKIRHIKVGVEAETDNDSHLTPEMLFYNAVDAIRGTLEELDIEIDSDEMCEPEENTYASGIEHVSASSCLGRVGNHHAHADGHYGIISGKLYATAELKLYNRKDLGYVELEIRASEALGDVGRK